MAKPTDTKSDTKAKVTALLERLDENELNHILKDPAFSFYARQAEEEEAEKEPKPETKGKPPAAEKPIFK